MVRRLILCLMILSVRILFADENILVDHIEENLGVSLKIPHGWSEKAFLRGKTEFIPTPTEGTFVEISLLEPEKEDYSTVSLEFFIYDLMNLADGEKKVNDFQYHKTTLSGLPAYDVLYSLNREQNFKIRMFFTSANEKIYCVRYQALERQFEEYEKLFVEKIIPSFQIQVIGHEEMRYLSYEDLRFGFSFYYPALWRVVQTNYSRSPMNVYVDPNSGTQVLMSSSSGEEMQRSLQKKIRGEGAYMGSQTPVIIAPSPDSFLTITVVGLTYKYEPSDAIASYIKALRDKAKELDKFNHLRQLPIQIDGNLAMEYAYSYQDKKDGKDVIYYVTHYVTYANERVYHIRYIAEDATLSAHAKEVERLIKFLKFFPVNS